MGNKYTRSPSHSSLPSQSTASRSPLASDAIGIHRIRIYFLGIVLAILVVGSAYKNGLLNKLE